MGNRAMITTAARDFGVYLHWNGGMDTVRPLLEVCEGMGWKSPSEDPSGFARICQVMGNFFGPNGLSLGINVYTNDRREDPGDNGIYVLEGWKVRDRICRIPGEQNAHDKDAMAEALASAMPEHAKAGQEDDVDLARKRCLIAAKDSRFGATIPASCESAVPAIAAWCRLAEFRSPRCDTYGWARLLQTLCNALGPAASEVRPAAKNVPTKWTGEIVVTYLVDEDWGLLRREKGEAEAPCGEAALDEIVRVDSMQPAHCRLGEYLMAEEVDVSEVRPGDRVWTRGLDGSCRPMPVVGVCPFDLVVNGMQCKGLPYFGMYYMDREGKAREGYLYNPNNFIKGPACKRVPKERRDCLK